MGLGGNRQDERMRMRDDWGMFVYDIPSTLYSSMDSAYEVGDI